MIEYPELFIRATFINRIFVKCVNLYAVCRQGSLRMWCILSAYNINFENIGKCTFYANANGVDICRATSATIIFDKVI